jgi:hypothetical protein
MLHIYTPYRKTQKSLTVMLIHAYLYFEHHHDENPAFIPYDSAWSLRLIFCHLTNLLTRAADQFGLKIATRNVLYFLTCYIETSVLQLF